MSAGSEDPLLMAMIGIDARKYFDYGIGTYLQNLLSAFSTSGGKHAFTLFVAPEEKKEIVTPESWRVEPVPWKKYSMGELLFLGRKARRASVDVFHAPHYTLPFGFPGPAVVTIHDLIHLRFPGSYSPIQRAYASLVMRHAVRSADAVITISEFTRADILSEFSIPSDKVHVIPLAADRGFSRLGEGEAGDFRARFRLRNPFVLYVGGVGHHKDIPTLLNAFTLLAERIKDCDLVFAGVPADRVEAHIGRSRVGHRIKCIGRVSAGDLCAAYSAASVAVTTSRYEGFGLPPLEAMACGTACVVSDAGALPEVVGDAAVVCRAGQAGEFADAMEAVLTRTDVREALIRRGKENVRRFSWKTTAQKTLEVYDSLS